MVLDIRHLGGDADRASATASAPATTPDPGPAVDLPALLTAATAGTQVARAAAIAELRVLVPGAGLVEQLCRIVEDPSDARRLTALHLLGRHRQWLASRSAVDRVLRWARAETDPEVAAAMAWVLRGRDAVQEFLLYPLPAMALEAALGLPVGESTLDAHLDALLVGRSAEVDRVLTQKLIGLHPSLATRAADHLLAVADRVSGEAMSHILGHLPQPPLFEAFVEGRSRPAFRAEPSPADTARSQVWHHVARLATQVLQSAPGAGLIRYLVGRSAADDAFARRHALFLKTAMGRTRDLIGPEMLDDLERLTQGASEERLERMARLLMDLADKIAGGESHSKVADLLEKWKSRSPALKLKIYHLQQGLT